MLISTMNDLPGYEIDEVFGEVFGLTVRSRNLGSQIGAGLKSIIGGELGGMTKMLAQGREEAIRASRRPRRSEGRERDRRDALRHVGARLDLDGDLRLRHRRPRPPRLTRRKARQFEPKCDTQRVMSRYWPN